MGLKDWFGQEGKRVLVTGASRGLGREMALALAEVGADVVITGRTAATLASTAADIEALGRRVWTVEADMGDPKACQAACERILAEMGPIDILINNIGGRTLNVPIAEESVEDWLRLMGSIQAAAAGRC